MKRFILIAFDLHDAPSCHHINKPYPWIIRRDHGNIHIIKIYTCYLSSSRKLAIIIFYVDRSFELQFFCLTELSGARNAAVRWRVEELLHCIHATIGPLSLYTIIIYKTNPIHQPHHQLISALINLHGCNIIRSLLPIYDLPLIYIPYSNHFVKAPRCYVVFAGGFDEQSWA